MAKCAKETGGSVLYECPGCGLMHAVNVERETGPKWSWNGSLNAPTFSPSVLVRWPSPSGEQVCHHWVREGRVEFCTDSTHPHAGKTMTLPDWED